MLVKEVEIPGQLLRAPEKRQLVIFAGAGVSMDAPSNYQNFKDLAIEIGRGSPLSLENGERLEHFLGRLEGSGVAVHERAAELLTKPESQPNALHNTLVQLFSSSDSVRIVTTNFDEHLTTTLAARFSTGQPHHYQAPALPVGSRFTGIVYLHGFVRGDVGNLVLTDADFGRAYLTEGWTRRFLLDLFSNEELFVVFVGYSADDPPIQYLTRALPVFGEKRRFALTPEDKANHWHHLGITPLTYVKRTEGPNQHGALSEVLAEWVRYTHLGTLGHAARIREVLSRPLPLDAENQSYLLECLKDSAQRKFFTDNADHRWLGWAQEQDLLPILSRGDQPLDESKRDFSRWCAPQVCRNPEFLLDLLARSRSVFLNPVFWEDLSRAMAYDNASVPRHLQAALIIILLQSAPAGDFRSRWLLVLEKIDPQNEPDLTLALIDEILKPYLDVNIFWRKGSILDLAAEYSLTHEFRRIVDGRIRDLRSTAEGLIALLERHLRIGRALVHGALESGRRWNVIGSKRAAIEPHEQNFDWGLLGVLIDITRDTLLYLLRSKPQVAQAIIQRWSGDADDQLFVRFAINGVREDTSCGVDGKIRWLIEHGFLYRYRLKHEVFTLIKTAYPSCSEEMRRELLRVIEDGDPEIDVSDPAISSDVKKTYEYEIYNVLVWLNRVAPDCPLAKQHLAVAQKKHQEFDPRQYPDFDSWVGTASYAPDRPTDDWSRLTPTQAAQTLLDPDAVAQLVVRDASRSWELVEALEKDGLWSAQHWQGILQGWSKALVGEKAWSGALDYLSAHAGDLRAHLGAMADFLENSVKSQPDIITHVCRGAAFELARKIVDLSLIDESLTTAGADDIVIQAIDHPIGKIALFWVRMADIPNTPDGTKRILPNDVATDVEEMLRERTESSLYAVCVLVSQLQYLYSLDPDWTGRILLPLLDWQKEPNVAKAAWHGFLVWGRWTRELLPHLLPYYLQTCGKLADFPEEYRRSYTGHVASIFIHTANASENLVRSFLTATDSEQRSNFARSVGAIISGLSDRDKSRIWDEHLDPYWKLRQQGIPRPLEHEELLQMINWLPALEPVFDRAIERACQGQPAASERGFLFFALADKMLADRHPEAVHCLLSHILPATGPAFYGCMYVERIVRSLHRSGMGSSRLKPICDQLARLRCDVESLWQEIVDSEQL